MLPTDLIADLMNAGFPQFENLLMMEPIAFQRLILSKKAFDPTAGPAADAQRMDLLQRIGRVAVVPIVGVTNKRYRARGYLSSYIATSAALRAAAADKAIEEIVLKIDSPGGFVSGVAEAADDIHEVAKIKPVTASIDGLGASAAYWLASQATKIYAGRMDEVGSIGVLAVLYDVSKMFADAGIKPEVFSTGKYKWSGVMGTALTDDQREYLQGLVDNAGDAFVADIARGRQMSEENVRKVADGRVFSSKEALTAGLIDGIEPFANVVAMIEARCKRKRQHGLREARLDVARRETA